MMKKFLISLGLAAVLAQSAFAWKPAGWAYFSWPYAYDAQTGDWHAFLEVGGKQYVYGYSPALAWAALDGTGLATGWNYTLWPYTYDKESAAWYYIHQNGALWCLNLRTANWSTYGQTSGSSWPAEITGTIKWLHTDVSSWPVTASLTASIGNSISFPYSKANEWPVVDGVNANPWVFVKLNGQWYAATFEWLRRGQTSKPKGVLDGSMGDHIKVSPLSNWRPKSGERIGIMVSGLARSHTRNVQERSNVYMVTWP